MHCRDRPCNDVLTLLLMRVVVLNILIDTHNVVSHCHQQSVQLCVTNYGIPVTTTTAATVIVFGVCT